jgi:hypothetical protein
VICVGAVNSIAELLPGRQAGAVEIDRPDEDAYGRVTRPERYQVVANAATVLINTLVEVFDVEATSGSSAVDFPDWQEAPIETVRLVPPAGAPLAFLITDFPGVLVRFGEWGREAFPGCGCDACDEQPTAVIERMSRLVEAAVEGRYEEEMTKRKLRYSFAGAWGGESHDGRTEPGERRRHGPPGAHKWPPWPKR